MKPCYVRRREDPIACSAVRLKREALDTYTDARLRGTRDRIRATLRIAIDVMGAEYIRALLLRPLRGTFVGDEIEAAGVAPCIHPGPELCTVEEIVAGHVIEQTKSAYVRGSLRIVKLRNLKTPPDVAILEHPRRGIFKVKQGYGPGLDGWMKWERPINDLFENIIALVASIAHDRAWRGKALSVTAAPALAKVAGYVGVTINDDDITEAVHARYDEVRRAFCEGKTFSSAMDAYARAGSAAADTRQQTLFAGDAR